MREYKFKEKQGDKMKYQRYRCKECGWIGEYKEILKKDSPFNPLAELWGCPECGDVNDFELVCDEPRCQNTATCGIPTPTGYRQTCFEHKLDQIEKRKSIGD